MIPRHPTELRGGLGHDPQQTSNSRHGSASSPDTGSTCTPAFPQTNDPQPPKPPELPNTPEERIGGKRGRPRKNLNPSTQRGLVRLFVEAYKTPFEQLTKAFDECGGYGRLWVRNFFQKITGAGPQSNLKLKDLRFSNLDHSPQPDLSDYGGANSGSTQNVNEDPTSFPQTPPQRLDEPGVVPTDSSTDESKPLRKAPRRREAIYVPTAGEEQNAQMYPSVYSGVREANPFNSSRDALEFEDQWQAQSVEANDTLGAVEGSERHRAPTIESDNQTDQVPSSIKFSPTPQILQEEKKKETNPFDTEEKPNSKKRNKKGNPRRRETTLSLTNMAIRLDGGVKGLHYKIAKRNTITRRKSSATSEFNLYYRTPTYMNVSAPTPCMYPLPGGGFSIPVEAAPPPAAVAIRILTTAWASRLHDTDVRDQLEKALPQREEEREVFVNMSDDRDVSPLHLAVAYGYPHTCQLLIECGANVDAVTGQGTNIHDFADSAARRAGEEMALYFRILHCRMFVCSGESPPAPRKLSNPRPKKRLGRRKSQQAANSVSLPHDRAHVVPPPMVTSTEAPYDTAGAFNIFVPTQSDFGPRRPSFVTEYTESPTLSALHEEHSASVSVHNEPSPNFIQAPLPLTAPLQSGPFQSILGADDLEANSINLYSTSEVMDPVHRAAGAPMVSSTGTGYPYDPAYEYARRDPWLDGSPHPHFSSFPRASPPAAAQGPTYPTAELQPNMTRPTRPSFGTGTSAQSAPNVTAMRNFIGGSALGVAQPYLGASLPNTYQQSATPPPFVTLAPEPPAAPYHYHHHHRHQHWQQQLPPSDNDQSYPYNPPSMPSSTAQELAYAPVPFGGINSNDPTSFHNHSANTSEILNGPWVCFFGNPQCQGHATVCWRCRQYFGL